MIMNYIPGLALRFYPGLTRGNNAYLARDEYIADGCKLAIYTGTAPTEAELHSLGNFDQYAIDNAANLVYQETTQLKFTYDPFGQKRKIQRYPEDSTDFTTLVAPVLQDLETNPDAIETDNSLYVLVYCPDKDATLNTEGNDLIMLVPGVGTGANDFVSLSKVDFTEAEDIYIRNMTISLFQGYQITDSQIIESIEDPENPGNYIDTVTGTKKSVFYNFAWANRISEAYRQAVVSPAGLRVTDSEVITHNLSEDYPSSGIYAYQSPSIHNWFAMLLKYVDGAWTTDLVDFTTIKQSLLLRKHAFICNQAMIDLIDEINYRAANQLFGFSGEICSQTFTENTRFYPRYVDYGGYNAYSYSIGANTQNIPNIVDIQMASTIVHYLTVVLPNTKDTDIHVSFKQFMMELGFDESLYDRAVKSVVHFDLDIESFVSTFDSINSILTIQNMQPAKLNTRYKQTIHNPTNEKLYLFLRREYSKYGITDDGQTPYDAGARDVTDGMAFIKTQLVVDGEEYAYNMGERIYMKDYTAISIGETGDGNVDLEYDNLAQIDYIDSFTTMIKIPNKF